MKVEANDTEFEVLGLANLLLKSAVEVGVRLEAEHALPYREDLNLAGVRGAEESGTRGQRGDLVSMGLLQDKRRESGLSKLVGAAVHESLHVVLIEEVFSKSNVLSTYDLRTVGTEHHLLNLAAECLSEELSTEAATDHLDLRVVFIDSLDQLDELRHPSNVEVVDGPTTTREDNHLELLELFMSRELALVGNVALPLLLASKHELAHKECLIDVLPVVGIVF